MANSYPPLPKFETPPVVETVIGVHFEPLPRFDVAQRALFWSRFREAFPLLEEKAPIDEIREEFGEERLPSSVQVRWQLSNQPTSPRLWAKSADGRHTMQIQQDALLVNWERDTTKTEPYLPYDKRRDDLAAKLSSIDEFVGEFNLGTIQPTSCFAKYINHIEYDRKEELAGMLQQLLTVWQNKTSDEWLPPVEQAALRLTFPFPEQQGRLHVNVTPGVRRRDKKHILQMDITARGVPRESTVEAALDWIDLGHDWIVRGFASLTRPVMHELWRRTQ